MPTLTAVMIVKNESSCLGACLDSLRGIVDGLVVADTGSTDATREIALAAGARVIDIPWENDFSKARNRCLEAADGDWLLQMDADEVLDPAGAARIRAVVDGNGLDADAIELIQANYCNDPRAWRWTAVPPQDPYARGFSGYLRVDIIRLFRNGQGYVYREAIHENLTESVTERRGRIRHEPVLVHHYGFVADPDRGKAKARMYLDICRSKAQAAPDSLKAWRDLGEQAWACGEGAEAERAFRKALAIDPLYLDCASTLGGMLMSRGALDEARTLFERLENAGISPPHVVTALAAIACRDGRLAEARERLEAVLHAVPDSPMARLCLVRVLDRQGEVAEAQQVLQALAAASPAIAEFQDLLRARSLRVEGERLFSEGVVGNALRAFVEAARLDPEDPYLHNDIGVALHALGETTRAKEAFSRALALAPGLPEAEENRRALGTPAQEG